MMNLFSAIEMGKNSILAQQQVFSVIGHNIANVNTPGYSRQVVSLESVRPSVIGLKSGGRGVELSGVRSIRDQFIDNQITDRRKLEGKFDTLSGIMASVEALFDESHGLGISDSLSSFFNGWSDVANNPTNIPTRNSLVAKAQSMSLALNNTQQRLTDQQELDDANIGVVVGEINTIAHEIASLNEEIAYAEGSGNPANDLLDRRERRIRELSELVGMNHYYDQSNHSVTIEVAGQPLVSFTNVNDMSVVRNPYNSNYNEVYINQYGQPAYNVTTDIENGKLGALLLARDGAVISGTGTVSGQADQPANPYTTLTFSQAHGLSVGDLVTIGNESRQVVSIPNTTEVVVYNFDAAADFGATAWEEREGYIPEYKKQLNKMTTGLIANINDLHQQGFALDTTTTDQNFFDMSTGTGNATIDAGLTTLTMTQDQRMNLSVGDAITVNGETRLVEAVTDTQVTVNTAFSAVAGPMTWEYANVQGAAASIAVESNLIADSSMIAASGVVDPATPSGEVGNNDIAIQIAALMDANNMVDSNNDGQFDYGTFHEYLHSTFSEVGNESATAQYELEANGSMLKYLENKRDSISGVSLDEEAANLMQFEKSYQALAQYMGRISQLTDLLMQLT
ncbi:MAG: flagellar hook-associated protein FlgK [bacterium]|nr:flagellar hook-associated protein FlgK [bacterium]